MERISDRLKDRGRLPFSDLFEPGQHKSALVGMFLAILELVRHYQVKAEQNDLFGEIWILPGTAPAGPIDASQIDNYEHGKGQVTKNG
jgi:segregation and condensation protein A